MTNQAKQLKGFFHLSHSIKLYIPSTTSINQEFDNSKLVNEVLTNFSDWFGGATSSQVKGAWTSPTQGLVVENVTLVYSFATSKQIDQQLENVIKLAMQIKKDLSQDSVAIEYDNQLYLI